MADIWIPVIMAGYVLILIIALLFLMQKEKDRSLQATQRRVEPYTDLLNAITGLYVAGEDDELVSLARMDLARQVNRTNIIAGPDVIAELNTLLELMGSDPRKPGRPSEEHDCLERLMHAIRRETREKREKKGQQPSFKFYLPKMRSSTEPSKPGTREL